MRLKDKVAVVTGGGLTTYLSDSVSKNARERTDTSWKEIGEWVEAHKVDGEPKD